VIDPQHGQFCAVKVRVTANLTEATLNWTRVTDPDDALRLLPAWFSGRMLGVRGTFGLLLTSGDVMRCTSITAVHLSSTGIVLLDVLLDGAGVPDGVDLAWRSKHFLGVPAPAATLATVNLAHVVAAVEFVAAEFVEQPDVVNLPAADEVATESPQAAPAPDAIVRAC
jgi:hypothetical protein